MNPGRMDRRITIQSRTLTKDAAGGRVETWADSFDAWAEIPKQTAGESITSDADRSTESRQFRIRYKAGLGSGNHRVVYQSKYYDIQSITEEGRKDRLLLDCRSVQALTHV